MERRVDSMITFSLNKCNSFFDINSENSFECIFNSYNTYVNCNIFDDLRCPCCKNKGVLSFHKTYPRNFSYIENDNKIDVLLDIAVLKCEHCTKCNNKQKYHALLPFFVLPYHIHEASMIINAAYQYILKQMKLREILERLKITHKLFYDWIKKINKYLLPASIILKENNDLIKVIKKIYSYKEQFLIEFFYNYQHPYFLFRITCIDLCITS